MVPALNDRPQGPHTVIHSAPVQFTWSFGKK